MINEFYIYMYLDQDNIPFYIGKGKDSRYKIQGHLTVQYRNKLLKNKICKVGANNIKIYFLHENITEEEAFSWESYWIKYIGRRDLGTGTLCNLTDGGEGVKGYIVSEETRLKMSEAKKGNSCHKGCVCSIETRKKIGKANKGKVRSVEFKQVISKSRKGKPSPMKGKKLSNEAKRKIGQALKGRIAPNRGVSMSKEQKKKISDSKKGQRKGIPLSEKHKRKISETLRARTKANRMLDE